MLGHKKTLLKGLINRQFSQGINKIDLLNALEEFIDEQYPEVGDSKYLTKSMRTKILQELAFDIKNAGGLEIWKKKMLLLGSPVVGSLPPKQKKKQ